MPGAQERLPIPSEQELQGWIPSQRFPSDHLSLVFDFAWRDSGNSNATASASQAVKSQAVCAQPDAVPSNGAIPESSSNALGEAYSNASLPAYQSDGLLEHDTDQQESAAVASDSKQPASRQHEQQQQQGAAGSDGQIMSSSVGSADAQAMESSRAAQGLVLPADAAHLPAAAAALARGDIVALPTDTLYGLAACANSQQVHYACSCLLSHCLLHAASPQCAQIKAQFSKAARGSEAACSWLRLCCTLYESCK